MTGKKRERTRSTVTPCRSCNMSPSEPERSGIAPHAAFRRPRMTSMRERFGSVSRRFPPNDVRADARTQTPYGCERMAHTLPPSFRPRAARRRTKGGCTVSAAPGQRSHVPSSLQRDGHNAHKDRCSSLSMLPASARQHQNLSLFVLKTRPGQALNTRERSFSFLSKEKTLSSQASEY